MSERCLSTITEGSLRQRMSPAAAPERLPLRNNVRGSCRCADTDLWAGGCTAAGNLYGLRLPASPVKWEPLTQTAPHLGDLHALLSRPGV